MEQLCTRESSTTSIPKVWFKRVSLMWLCRCQELQQQASPPSIRPRPKTTLPSQTRRSRGSSRPWAWTNSLLTPLNQCQLCQLTSASIGSSAPTQHDMNRSELGGELETGKVKVGGGAGAHWWGNPHSSELLYVLPGALETGDQGGEWVEWDGLVL